MKSRRLPASDCHVMPGEGQQVLDQQVGNRVLFGGWRDDDGAGLVRLDISVVQLAVRSALAVILVVATFVVAILSNWLIHRRYVATMES